MYLWNDYEGSLLAGAFPLEKLLRTEGRSAFFSTRDRSGNPAVIRLTEALNDQDVLRARYTAVQSAGKAHLVGIEAFGEAEVDGQPLFYLVMEPTQESLAEILPIRRLSIEETHEVANALVSAIEALHARGLIHGQVEPANVLAAGEVIKLRSDCVRMAPEGTEADRAYAADVLGVAGVLNQSLTQAPLHDASDALALPEPYASIVRNTVRGNWSIEQVAAELRRFVKPPTPSKPAPTPAPQPHVNKVATPPPPAAAAESRSVGETLVASARLADKPSPAAAPAARREDSRPISSRAGIAPSGPLAPLPSNGKSHTSENSGETQLPLVYAETSDEASKVREREAPSFGHGSWRGPEEEQSGLAQKPAVWIGGAVVLLVLFFLLWHLVGSSHAKPQTQTHTAAVAPAAPAPVDSASTASSVPAPAPVNRTKPSAATEAEQQPTAEPAATGGKIWRVVAYTYNSEAQAQAQAHAIAARHPDVHPEAFSRNGRPPYLVTLGGPMTREQAIALRARARKEGLAHGAYIQNYTH
jgi:hypothetical protein